MADGTWARTTRPRRREAEQAAAKADAEMKPPEVDQPPSSSEMAGDGAAGGDGIDEPGWD